MTNTKKIVVAIALAFSLSTAIAANQPESGDNSVIGNNNVYNSVPVTVNLSGGGEGGSGAPVTANGGQGGSGVGLGGSATGSATSANENRNTLQNTSANTANNEAKSGSMSGALSGALSGSQSGANAANNVTLKPEQNQALLGSGNSTNKVGQSLTNGNLSGSKSQAGSDNQIQIDASDRSSSSSNYQENHKYVFIPSVVPATPPSTVGVGNIIKETTSCGPLQKVVKTQVVGKFFGLTSSEDVQQGYTYDLEAYKDANDNIQAYHHVVGSDGVTRVLGHQAVIFSTVVGTANARNLALGGGSSNGGWGQGGSGTSATNQQLVTNIQLRTCELGTIEKQK